MNYSISVQLGNRSYTIQIKHSHFADITTELYRLRPNRPLCICIADENTYALAELLAEKLRLAEFPTHVCTVPPGESSKSLTVAEGLYDELALANADRQTVIVAVGGGVIGDLAGFVAATYNRGLALFMVPTTLLAMVDSSVGGKVGVNLTHGKNLVGAFHQPIGVWIDLSALETLPDREFRSGLAEVVKYGVIADPDLFVYLEHHAEAILARSPNELGHIIRRSCEIKAHVVAQDEHEVSGLRATLNYGHTFAHAFETISGYGQWLHGEAVAAGMVCASRLAERIGMISPEVTQRQMQLLARLQLPTTPPRGDTDEFLAVMRRDKKAVGGRMRFILPTTIGEVRTVSDVPEVAVRAILEG